MRNLRLKPWEYARLSKRLIDEIDERTTGRFSDAKPFGDPSDIPMLRKALKILRERTGE